ncbi:MAG: cystathionine beta-synthase [Bacteroidetes bacterium]|nr:cystathionine beta-synthase [Bacteroidota bacterium]
MLTDLKKIDYKENILGTIGNTPLVKLNKILKGLKPTVFAKLEFFNPGGSVKDRIGVGIIEEAEREGRLKPGGTIVEATSGNTGMGLALAAAVKGYKCVFTMPDKMSQEKIRLLRAYGAEVIVTPTAVAHESPESYTEVAKRIVRETPNSILANQYFNPKNPEAHVQSTGPELWKQTAGQIDYFVCGVGTGGTITGTGKYLKEQNPNVKVVGIDIKGSILTEYFYTKKFVASPKTYKVEGIGQDWIPGTLNFDYVDEMILIDDKESFLAARRLTKDDGIFTGGSGGTAIAGCLKLCERLTEKDVVVVLLPDTGERYISKMYNDDWMRENRFLVPDRITLRYVLTDKDKKIPQIVSVYPTDVVRHALNLIRTHNISQIPVVDGTKCVGSIDETHLMREVLANPKLVDASVKELMDAPFPIVDIDAEISFAVEHLMKKVSAVLVEEGNKIVGVITKYDVLEYLAK